VDENNLANLPVINQLIEGKDFVGGRAGRSFG
jgi:hypothetical protein